MPHLESGEGKTKCDKEFEDALNRPTSAYDSHPGFQDRVKYVEDITNAPKFPGDSTPATSLVAKLDQLQVEMMTIVQENFDKSFFVIEQSDEEIHQEENRTE